MRGDCFFGKTCTFENKSQTNCGAKPKIFRHMELLEGEEWRNLEFENEDADLCAVLVVTYTEPEPFKGFYIRSQEHPYEPNFETRTYNLLEFCQQDKVKKYIEAGKAGNLIVWTRDKKDGRPYLIGAYKAIQKLRKTKGYCESEWEPRIALLAKETYMVSYDKRLPIKNFENEFRKYNLCCPPEKREMIYESFYGRYYVIDKRLTKCILNAIEKNAVTSKVYWKLGELYEKEMMKSSNRLGKRFFTKKDMRYAKKEGIL